jgi:thioredoxin-dependent peroxiredoxin
MTGERWQRAALAALLVIPVAACSRSSDMTPPKTVDAPEETALLKPGDAAPAFTLPDQDGRRVSLSDFRDGPVLVYFYPRADTPGCTVQACSIRDAGSDLRKAGLRAVGISPDAPGDQKRFDAKFTLGFPLLSDPDHRVAEAYGAWGEKTSSGKKTAGIIRSSFLVGGDGRIVAAWRPVKPEETVPKALEAAAARGVK